MNDRGFGCVLLTTAVLTIALPVALVLLVLLAVSRWGGAR